MSDIVQMFKNIVNSEGFQENMAKEAKKQAKQNALLEYRIGKFHAKYKDNLDAVVERLLLKYDSDEYINRELSLGYQPRETLLWFLFEYATHYCEVCLDEKYLNDFTGAAYYIGSYVIQVMYGQGSVIRLEKLTEPRKHNTYTNRFNLYASTIEEAKDYIINRGKQLLRFGYKLSSLETYEWGVDARFVKGDNIYQAIYILHDYRGKGLFPTLVKTTIVTSPQCGIEPYLKNKGFDYVTHDLVPNDEYLLIANFYGSEKAERSGVYKMNHIDEGLAILEQIGASDLAKRAYCLHPIYQSDADFAENCDKYVVDKEVLVRVLEYRSVANEYLSTRTINDTSEIRLSPLKDVNDMLIADKIQNRKDFELYHKDIHERSDELKQYFFNWLWRLGVREGEYQEFKKSIL